MRMLRFVLFQFLLHLLLMGTGVLLSLFGLPLLRPFRTPLRPGNDWRLLLAGGVAEWPCSAGP